MKVRTDAWHFKVLRACGVAPPKTLCSYFWCVVSCVTLVPLTAPIWFPLGKAILWYDNRKPKDPGLVRQWLRAKKQKICPFIVYEIAGD